MAQTVEKVIEVISKPTEERGDNEIETIAPWLRKRNQLLNGLEKQVLYDILKNCDYQRCHKDDVIIRQGDVGEIFYIILHGTVSVYIDSQISGEDSIATVGAPPAIDKQTKRKGKNSKPPSPAKKISGANRAKFGKFIVKFEPGKSFGEIALLTKGSIRNASIIVDEEIDFLVVHRVLFNRCLKVHEEREFASIRDFVDTHPFFLQWQRRLKRFLEMSVRKEVYDYNSVIIKQGDPVTALYFIYEGEAKVIVDPAKHKHQYRKLWPFEAITDLYSQEFEWLREARKEAIAKKYGQDPTVLQTRNDSLTVRRSEGYAAAEKLIHGKTVTLCSVHNMEVIGDAEVISKLDTYMQSVVSTSTTQVYVLDMKNYDRLILKKNPATLDVIQNIVSDKLLSRMSTQQGKQLPLLKYLHFKIHEENYQSAKELPPLKTTKGLPDNELLQKYLLKSFIEGKTQICEPHVPGMMYFRELMQDKARIRENIRLNQGIKRKREKLFSDKLKTRKPRSSAALKEALELMEEEDMVAWREHVGKDFLEMVIPPTKSSRKGSVTKSSFKAENKATKLNNVSFNFTSLRSQPLPEVVTEVDGEKQVEMSLDYQKSEGNLTLKVESAVSVDSKVTAEVPALAPVPLSSSDNLSIMEEISSESQISKNRSYVQNSTEIPELHPSYSPRRRKSGIVEHNSGIESFHNHQNKSLRQVTESKPTNQLNKPVLVTQLTAIREEGSINPGPTDQKTKLANGKISTKIVPTTDSSITSRVIVYEEKEPEDITNKSIFNSAYERFPPRRKNDSESSTDDDEQQNEVNDNMANNSPKQDILEIPPENDGDKNNNQQTNEVPEENFDKQEDHLQEHNSDKKEPALSTGARAWSLTRQFVQQKIEKKKQDSSLFDDRYSEYKDYDTSERTLNFLENRLRAFHLKYSTNKRPIKLPKLRRFRVEQDEIYRRMRQGGRVKIKPRVCDLAQSEYKIKDHQHVHYHMVPKLIQVQDLRKTRMVMQFLVDDNVKKTTDSDVFIVQQSAE